MVGKNFPDFGVKNFYFCVFSNWEISLIFKLKKHSKHIVWVEKLHSNR
jgi:hypothetical protein